MTRIKIFLIFLFLPFILNAQKFYWEDPVPLSAKNGQFLKTASNKKIAAAVWEETVKTKNGIIIYISVGVYENDTWNVYERLAETFSYSKEVPSLTSITIGDDGSILVALLKNRNTFTFLKSGDNGKTFIKKDVQTDITDLLSPYLSVSSTGKYLLFASHGIDEKFSIFFSSSTDGFQWNNFTEFSFGKDSNKFFLPSHTVADKTDLLVFQGIDTTTDKLIYNLFSSFSKDGGASWSQPIKLTKDMEIQNQRPSILYYPKEKKTAVIWERSNAQRKTNTAAFVFINSVGEPVTEIETLSVNKNDAFTPKIILYKDSVLASWSQADNDKHSLYIAVRKNASWEFHTVHSVNGKIFFPTPFFIDDNLQIVWQEGTGFEKIMYIQPDHKVKPPKLTHVKNRTKQFTEKKKIRIEIKFPHDSSGIAGYSYTWEKDTPPEFIEPKIKKLKSDSIIEYEPDEDGVWHLGIRICDYAGNWSDTAYISTERDTTPPEKPTFDSLVLDTKGFLTSNTFKITWQPPNVDTDGNPEKEIAGYICNLYNLGTIEDFKFKIKKSGRLQLNDNEIQNLFSDTFNPKKTQTIINSYFEKYSFDNYDNGFYVLSVSAVDSSGNIGAQAFKYFALNKYKPYTIISNIEAIQSKDGSLSISILGKGFSSNGNIEKIYIKSTSDETHILTLDKDDFSILNDRLISDINIKDLDAGTYTIGLYHSQRGIYFSKKHISIDNFGNVKFGSYGKTYISNWKVAEKNKLLFDNYYVILILFFISIILFFSIVGIVNSAREFFAIKKEIHALLKEGIIMNEKKKKQLAVKVKGGGLMLKFILFTTTLVISVILILTVPLGAKFSESQETLLTESLISRVEVLLESLTSGAKAYLPSKNLLELGFLPSQITALKEAKFATITGTNLQNKKTGYNFVWASNDENITEKIDSEELVLGESEFICDEMQSALSAINKLNEEAKQDLGELALGITKLTKDALNIALNTDSKSIEARTSIQRTMNQMEEKLNNELSHLSAKGLGSIPKFDSKKLSRDITEYIFYKPVLYRTGNSDSFVHGMVYVQISTSDLLKQIDELSRSLIRMILYISVISLAAGLLGSYILASIIIAPIKKLAEHVAMISNTEDKEQLANKNIKIKSKDEIGLLGYTINNMTDGLAAAAAASKDLTMGKEIQKMFLPLDSDNSGRKLTCGKYADANVEFFGYYEGARGVSGDYFDYIKLDERYYAIIKCDVAGKGVPAALIMVEVATLFLDYFKDWKFKTHGLKLDYIVSRINDLIESRGFKGRFAAFTLCILDSVTHNIHFCNAGDNVINIYDSRTNKMKEVTLTEVSAAGVFPTFMIDMKGGFKVETVKFNKGDVLFLYTDGIEEAKRIFRNSKLEPVICKEAGLNDGDIHETHSVGQDGEELGKERVCKIIESIFTHTSFSLKKWHNPIPDEDLHFNFTHIEGSLEDAVIGLVSVEKVFRMYQDPKATPTDMIKVDKKIDIFLNKYFNQYQKYCGNRKENTEYNEYLYYTNIREDEQYDDLTILAVKMF